MLKKIEDSPSDEINSISSDNKDNTNTYNKENKDNKDNLIGRDNERAKIDIERNKNESRI